MSERAAPRRRVPRQSRSRRTVAQIRQAAVDVLVIDGLDGLNTNAIAQRAGVSVATLYGYFPDKFSIIYDLFESFETERSDTVLAELATLRDTRDWRTWVHDIIDRVAGFRVEWPAGVVLRRALVLRPELQALDDHSTALTARALGDALADLADGLSEDECQRIARMVVTTITHQLDLAFAPTPADFTVIEELKKMVVRYLEPYLEPYREPSA